MQTQSIRWLLVSLALSLFSMRPAFSQNYAPAVDYGSILDMPFFESGIVQFGDYDVYFGPQNQIDAVVEVVNAKDEIIGTFKFFPDYVHTEESLKRIRVQGPAEVSVAQPGNYRIDFKIGGQVATRFPFTVHAVGNADPFITNQKFRYSGPWQRLAYIKYRDFKDTKLPDLVCWSGPIDLPEGKSSDRMFARLFRNGILVGHSKRNSGHIAANKHTKTAIPFFAPHEDRRAHEAAPISIKDLSVAGNYTIHITRQSDNQNIRRFDFTVANGQIQQLPRSVLGYQPAPDFLVPRQTRLAGSTLIIEPAIWLESK